ncbi:MAG: NEW3 domain-containing protein [Anaerolineales bacterium]|nr:NEW3 domain-containing protein [Anaerolineales bacterium]MCS7249149.1 NEW3 domain-containing protein [Anaerolineales bacterium]MDW8162962.1 NEW3 domain-containing protein [Anaerolineales bacterium]MDW8448070.1 NEW3 domain-containing protein [Anaerolineales bacterium]
MRRTFTLVVLILVAFLALPLAHPVYAQEGSPNPTPRPLTLFTEYPSQVVGIGETITIPMTLRGGTKPQIVQLEATKVPEGWTVTFRGGGKIVKSVFVEPDTDADFDLRLEQPKDVQPGEYTFTVRAKGQGEQAELTLQITIQEKTPPSISLDCDLPTLRGSPTQTFRYDVSLRNEGSDELSVNLSAEVDPRFQVKFRLTGQEIINLPLPSKETKRLSVEVQPIANVPAGSYPIKIVAEGAEARAELGLVAEVTGQPEISITAPDGRLSGQAYAGRDSSLKIILRNNGSAPALNVQLSSSEPSGWTVSFDPKTVEQIPAGEQVEVTANIRPSEKAVAGDYIVNITARPSEGASKTAEFRITVLTSTLWGVVGIVLIAVAVGVVGMAVMRFGRR